MSDRLKKVGMFSTDSNFCFSTWVREVVQRSVQHSYNIVVDEDGSTANFMALASKEKII